jgi:hypothetical protein
MPGSLRWRGSSTVTAGSEKNLGLKEEWRFVPDWGEGESTGLSH